MMDAKEEIATSLEAAEDDATKLLTGNVEAILAMDAEDARKKNGWERLFEALGHSMEKPLFFCFIAAFVAIWIALNLLGARIGFPTFDRPPFPWLQGTISLASLVTAAVVLINQNATAKRESIRDQLQLQLIMLTEQKVAKVISLVEELRKDLPMIGDRHDPEAETLKTATHPKTVLDTIKGKLNPADLP